MWDSLLSAAALERASMAGFSLWKTYIGPMMAAALGYSYADMLLYNVGGALASTAAALVISDRLPRRGRPVVGFDRTLRRALRFWRTRGDTMAAFLSPILLGIPVYVLIARKFRTSRRVVLLRSAASATFWSSGCYFFAAELLQLSGRPLW